MMSRAGGLAVSRTDEVEDARPGRGSRAGRVGRIANDNGPGRPKVDGDVRRGRVTRVRFNEHLVAALQRGEDVEEVRLRGAANDDCQSVRQHLRKFLMVLYGIVDAVAGLVRR
ncbi:hypothetical protein [Methylobacterium sp. WSM2598]|uniref:hypothetical protein n=1 Tax=Methylobacterium sp. WSM2598 TaxID=398261 RepID=UPI00037CF9E2|nr:hypothetical protein [Methylobacterium sp. WSM2598]